MSVRPPHECLLRWTKTVWSGPFEFCIYGRFEFCINGSSSPCFLRVGSDGVWISSTVCYTAGCVDSSCVRLPLARGKTKKSINIDQVVVCFKVMHTVDMFTQVDKISLVGTATEYRDRLGCGTNTNGTYDRPLHREQSQRGRRNKNNSLVGTA